MSNVRTKKAMEAVAALLQSEKSRSMDMLRLLKLLYLADRESVRVSGFPIVGNRPVAMDNGPLDSEVYDLLRSKHGDSPETAKYISRCHYRIELIQDPVRSYLSDAELAILNAVSQRYEDLGTYDLVEITHSLEEWKASYRPKTSTPIRIETLLKAVGRGAEDISDIVAMRREEDEFDALFTE